MAKSYFVNQSLLALVILDLCAEKRQFISSLLCIFESLRPYCFIPFTLQI